MLQPTKDDGVRSQQEPQVIADARATAMVQDQPLPTTVDHANFTIFLGPRNTSSDYRRLSTNSDTQVDRHSLRRSSSVLSGQSNDWSEYNLPLSSIKVSAVSSVTGPPEFHLVAKKGEHMELGSLSTGFESDLESSVSRDALKSDDTAWLHGIESSLMAFNLGMSDDVTAFGGHGSQCSIESSLAGSLGGTECFGVSVEEPKIATLEMENKLKRVQELLRLREEQGFPQYRTNDDEKRKQCTNQMNHSKYTLSIQAS
jgi:hypothetical protein